MQGIPDDDEFEQDSKRLKTEDGFPSTVPPVSLPGGMPIANPYVAPSGTYGLTPPAMFPPVGQGFPGMMSGMPMYGAPPGGGMMMPGWHGGNPMAAHGVAAAAVASVPGSTGSLFPIPTNGTGTPTAQASAPSVTPTASVPHPAPLLGTMLIYGDEDISMEEKRAELQKYRYAEDNIKDQVDRLNNPIESRLQALKPGLAY